MSIGQELRQLLEDNPEVKALLEKSIALAKHDNPDKSYNPVQSLEEYYVFVDWVMTSLPWEHLPGMDDRGMYEKIDQTVGYFYFLNDRPLEELNDKGYFHNGVIYVEPYRSWVIKFTRQWGEFLDTKASWNEEYYKTVKNDKRFLLDTDLYEDPSNWHTFNQFFSRRLSSLDKRPIDTREDIVVSPADSSPQGVWRIDGDGLLLHPHEVRVKTKIFNSVPDLLYHSKYRDKFKNGYLTHTFLDITDYHRYHFPVSGKILEFQHIPGDDAGGGLTWWDEKTKSYVYDNYLGWQMIQTRDCLIMETDFGLCAILPVGMSQISSVNITDNVKVGNYVQKGDELGYFLFGGSDIVMLFEEDSGFELLVDKHTNMGEAYGRIHKKTSK